MNQFTDDDLKRLKVFIASEDKGNAFVGADFIVEAKLRSLIARLEAAEKLIELRGTHIPSALVTREIETAVWAWRKAAGK